MENKDIIQNNKTYWNTNADLWFGTTALPEYGVKFVTEDDLHLFGDVSGKKMLEICCGSGHSLKYHADRNAAELWGVDLSHKQIENAKVYLEENGYTAKFICAPMESDLNIPTNYFDESYFKMPVHDSEIVLCNRKISTYINALARAGFFIEQMIEETDKKTMESVEDDGDKARKARMLPISVCFKARKL